MPSTDRNICGPTITGQLPPTRLGDFTTFANGYKDTASVDLVFGQITGDTSMSQTYYTVPVILKTTTNTGAHNNYAACYLVHVANPAVFSARPFNPMGIDRGSADASDINANDATVLATACSGYPVGPNPVPVSERQPQHRQEQFPRQPQRAD